MRRGQVTVLVLLGIVLLITTGFAIYAMLETGDQSRPGPETVASEQEAVNQLNQYLQSCVESEVAASTQQVLLQGGVLYEDQNGSIPPDRVTEYQPLDGVVDRRVFHGVRDDYPCSTVFASPPDYPTDKFFSEYDSYSCAESTPEYGINTVLDSAGYLGVVSYPETCRFLSTNRQENADSAFTDSRCGGLTTTTEEEALETHLEDAAENALRTCANNKSVANRTGDAVTITGDPNVSVRYGTDTTAFKSFIPLRIQVGGGEPTVTRHSFTYQDDIAISTMWSNVYDALLADVKNPRYNLTEQLGSYDVSTETVPATDTTVYEIQHQNQTLNGEPLTIVTAVEQRSPVLNTISQTAETGVDVIVEATNEYQLAPEAIDPDDQYTPNISYEGFGETTTAVDPGSAVLGGADPAAASTLSEGGPPATDNRLSQGDSHTVRDPYTWGLYETRVNASGAGERTDWQRVDVLVVDKPRLTVNASTPESPDSIVAEAPFTINGSNSRPPKAFGLNPFFNTDWTIGNTSIETNTSGFTLSDLTTWNIGNIDEKIAGIGVAPSKTNVSLTASANTTYRSDVRHSVLKDIPVKRCQTNTDRAGKPYPYNNSPTFKTRNPCCIGGTPDPIAGQSEPCHRNDLDKVSVTQAEDWLDAEQAKTSYRTVPASSINASFEQARTNLEDYASDANVSVDLTRYCGGTRGNTCGGPVSISITNETT